CLARHTRPHRAEANGGSDRRCAASFADRSLAAFHDWSPLMKPNFARILVPVDFSTTSETAIVYAQALAARFAAAIELLHVVEDPVASGAWDPDASYLTIPDLTHRLVEDAGRRLADTKGRLDADGVTVETRV